MSSHAVKYRCTHKELSGDNSETTFIIEILEDGFSGSVTEVKGMGDVFRLNYDKIDARNPTENPVQKGRLEFYLAVEDSGDLAILEEFLAADEDQYQMRLKQDGSVRWTGFILTDLLEYSEGDYPFSGKIVAKDLTRLSGIDFPLTDDRVTLITTLADFLDDVGLGLDIYTYTSWITEDTTDSDDFLNQIYNERKAFREFGRTGDEDPQQITIAECLERFLRNYGLILRQENNAWRVYQITALSDPENVDEFVYDYTGSQTATNLNQDLTVSIDRVNRYLLPPSTNEINPGIKRAKATFQHRTKVSNIQFNDRIELDPVDNPSESFSQFFVSDGDQEIDLEAVIEATYTGQTVTDAVCVIQIIIGGYYWDGSTLVSSPTTFEEPLTALLDTGKHRANLMVNIDSIPADADGTFQISFSNVTSPTDGDADSTTISNVFVDIINPIASENTEYIDYQLTQSDGYSTNFEIQDTWFGDGPTGYSPAALRYDAGDNQFTSDVWQFRGTTTGYRNFHENLLKEVINPQRGPRRNIQAQLWGDYNSTQIVSHDSKHFFFLGGDLTGRNYWNAQILELNIEDGSDDFDDINKYVDESVEGTGTSSSSTGGSGGGLSEAVADQKYAKQASNASDFDSISDVRTNLGLEIGSDVQAWSSVLDDVAANDGSADLDLNSLGIISDNADALLLDRTANAGVAHEYGMGISTQDALMFRNITDNSAIVRIFSDGKAELYNDADIDGRLSASDAQLDNLTDNRILLAGTGGLIEDDADFTFDGDTFEVSYDDGMAQIRNAGVGTHIRLHDGSDQTFIVRNYLTDEYQANFNLGGIEVEGKSRFIGDGGSIGLSDLSNSYVLVGTASVGVGIDNNEIMSAGSGLNLGTTDSNPLRFNTNGTLRASFTSDGDLNYLSNIESDNFAEAAGLYTGFQMGQSEFKAETIRANELRVKAFVAEISAALYGEDILTKSRGVLSRDFTVPAVGSTSTLYVEDLEGQENSQVFETGDWIRMRVVDRSGGGLQVFNVWGKVTSYSDLSGGEQSWAFTRESGGAANTGDVVYEGSIAIDYGTSGDAVIVRSVIGSNTPRDTQLTWTTDPIDANNYSIVTRTGILDDITDASGAGFYSENAFLTGSITVGDLSKTSNYMSFDGSSMDINTELFNLESTRLRLSDINDGFFRVGVGGSGDEVGMTGAESGSGGADSVAFWAGDTYTNRASAPIWMKRGGDVNFADIFTVDASAGTVGLASFTADSDSFTLTRSGYDIVMGNVRGIIWGWGVTDGVGDDEIWMGEVGGDHIFAVRNGGSEIVELGSRDNFIAGWDLTNSQLQSTNLSGGGDGVPTTDGILFNSAGYISAPNFWIDSDGAGALGDLDLSGDLNMLTDGEMSDGSTWRISGDNGFDFQGGEAGINKIEWREGDFDNNTQLMGELYAYYDSGDDETNFVMRAQNTVGTDSNIFLTATNINLNTSGRIDVNSDMWILDHITFASSAVVTGYMSFDGKSGVNKGELRLPNHTDTSRAASPNPGELIYNTDAETVQVGNNSGGWKPL